MRDRNAPLNEADVPTLAWDKMGGLLPAVIQDAATRDVLMLGYMSPEALEITLRDGRATFHSRSKGRIWTKGEISENHLEVKAIFTDCDEDALLVIAEPKGPTCHLGTDSCFSAEALPGIGSLARLARIVRERRDADPETSYTASLLREGPTRIAQKVGEEGVEMALAGAAANTAACIEEAADLLYHLTVLMEARGFGWEEVTDELRRRCVG
jgi:phosphoribosyl-AMP cyclohydrolase / phosphoribosyl-ATP pyrophosphohydrolase